MLSYLPIYIAAIVEGEIYYSKVCADAAAGRLLWLPVLVAGAIDGERQPLSAEAALHLLRAGRYRWLNQPRIAAGQEAERQIREFIAERGTGELGVYAAADNSLQASLTMPRNPLGRLQSASVSPDFRWLAVSQRDRGAIWDLRRNALVGQIRGFRSGGFSSDGALVADFPKSGDQKRQFMRIEPATTSGITLDAPADDNTGLVGGYLLSRRVLKKGEGPEGGVTYDLREATTGRSLWTRTFIKEEPNYAVDASEHMVLLAWPSSMKSARDETQGEPALAKQLAELGSSSGYLVEIIDVQSGAARGKVVINTNRNSFRFKRATVAGDWLLLADTSDREQVYSVSTGQAKGEFFGDYASISAEAGLVSAENGPTSVMVYDLRTLERRANKHLHRR
jgi:hypothetical protein